MTYYQQIKYCQTGKKKKKIRACACSYLLDFLLLNTMKGQMKADASLNESLIPKKREANSSRHKQAPNRTSSCLGTLRLNSTCSKGLGSPFLLDVPQGHEGTIMSKTKLATEYYWRDYGVGELPSYITCTHTDWEVWTQRPGRRPTNHKIRGIWTGNTWYSVSHHSEGLTEIIILSQTNISNSGHPIRDFQSLITGTFMIMYIKFKRNHYSYMAKSIQVPIDK